MTMPALLSAALMLLLLPGTSWAVDNTPGPITVVVNNTLADTPLLTYATEVVAYRGILLGALNRLMNSNQNFTFTYTEDPNYGPYLESVNGVAGNDTAHTYWELLVKKPNGTVIRPDVGIGCYIPHKKDEIILKFTTW